MEFRVLGPVEVRDGDARVHLGGPKRRALLAMMLLNANRVVPVDRLIGAVWGETPPATATAQVQAAVSALRKALGTGGLDGDRILTRPPGYLVRLQPGELDLQLFERDADVGRRALAEGNVEQAAAGLRAALDWWQGAALSDLADTPLRSLAVGLEERRMAALEERIEVDLALGRHAGLIPELTALIASNPLRERLRGQLILALYRAGRQADALAAYRDTRQVLVDELGLDPGPELQRLEQAILTADPALDLRPAVPAQPAEAGVLMPAPCPYRGLTAFSLADSGVFFGRRVEIAELVQRLRGPGPVTVVGPSGCGKSSLIFAGVLPELLRDTDPAPVVLTFRPSYARNLHSGLAAALLPALEPRLSETEQIGQVAKLAKELEATGLGDVLPRLLARTGAKEVVLVIDQAEELLAQHSDQLDRFAEQVFGPCAPRALKVVSTMRADFLTAALSRPALSAPLRQSIYTLGAMTAEQLREIVTEPVAGTGVVFQDGLADRILADVGTDPGALPLLGLTLTLLWERQSGGQLTHEAYDALGRVPGSLARYAEEVWRRTNLADDEDNARQLFTQLVLVTAGGEVTRRVASSDELGEAGWALARRLATSRLLVTGRNAEGQETVELAHEAPVRSWARLGQWIEADREFRQWQESLRADLARWEQAERDPSLLSRGPALADAKRWSSERPGYLSPAEIEFIGRAGDQQRGVTKRRRLVLSGLAAGVVLTLLLGGLFVYQRDVAGRESAAATSRALAAASANWAQRDPAHAARLALAAYQAAPTAEATNAVFRPYLETQGVETVFSSPQGGLYAVDASRDGRTVAAATDGQTATVWARPPGQEPRSIRTPVFPSSVDALRLSPNGRTLWLADTGWLYRFDVSSGQLRKVTEISGPDFRLAVSANGATVFVVTATDNGHRADLWDVRAGRRGPRFVLPAGDLREVTASPDGRSLVVELFIKGSVTRSAVEVWGLGDGSRRVVFDTVDDVVVTPAGDIAVTCRAIGKTTRRYTAVRLTDGGELGHADLGPNPVCTEFAVDSTGLAVVATDESAYADVLDLRSGRATARLRAPFLSDSRMLPDLTGAAGDLRLALYDEGRVAVLNVPRADSALPAMRSLKVRPDGKSLVSVSADGSELRIYPISGASPVGVARRPAPYWRSPSGPTNSLDGTMIADRLGPNRVAVRRAPGLELVREITTASIPPRESAGPGELNTSLYFDTANRLVSAVGHLVEVWDPVSGKRQARLDLDQLGITRKGQVAWVSPGPEQGQLGLVVVGQPDVRRMDARTGRLVGTIPVGTDVQGSAFQDGSPYVAVTREGNVVEVWDWQRKRRVLGPLVSARSGRIGDLAPRGRFVITDPGEYRIVRVGSTTPELSLKLDGLLQVTSVSRDGRAVVYGDALDSFIGVLRLQPAAWREHICSVFGSRGFTDKERAGLPASTPDQPLCPR